MPTYEIESGGQVLEIDSEQPPTPKDIQAALRALAPKAAPNTERRIAGQVVRTPWEGFKAIVNGYAPASVRVEEELAKPAAPLRDLPDFEASPNLPSQLVATAGNVGKEIGQFLTAPSNLPIATGMGALATAGRLVPQVLPLAKKGLVAAQAGFAAQMAPGAVDATKRAQAVRADPQATDLERSEATRDAVLAGGMTLLAALGAIHEIRPALARELKGAKPVDAVAKIREEAARAKDAAERATLESTADALDERYTQPVERVSDLPPQLALDERYFAPRETVLNVEPTLALDERYSATPEAVPAVAEMPAAPAGPLADVAPKTKRTRKAKLPLAEDGSSPKELILWGRKQGTSDQWVKLTDKTTDAEMARRKKDGWDVLRFEKGESPNAPIEAAPKPLAEEPRVEAVHEAPAPEAPASAAVEPVRSLDDPKPAEPTQSAPSSAAKAEEQMDLLTVDHPKAPVSARINQKITDLEALKARVEANEEFPPSVVAAYEKRAKEAAARLDAFKDEQSPEWSRAYDENETAQGDFKAVSENALSDGIDLIDSKIALYAKRKAVVDAARVKEALAEAKVGPLAETAEVPATVTPTPDGGKVIAPTPAAERRVSTFADKKKIKVQREFLGDALKRAAKDAPDELAFSDEGRADMALPLAGSGTPDSIAVTEANIEALKKKYPGAMPVGKDGFNQAETIEQAIRNRHAEHITIEVPDDGTFRIPNSKAHIEAFAENVQSKFGKKTASLPSPFSDPATQTNNAPSASGIGKLAKKPTEADLAAASKLAVSEDPRREILSRVYSDDGFAVSTDGRRLFLVAGGKGLNAAEIKAAMTKGNPKETVTSFPNWRQVIPGYVKAEGGKIRVTNNAPKTKLTVDTKTALNQLNQAIAVINMEKGHPSVRLYDVGDGKLGLSGQNPDLGNYMSDGVTDASKTLTAVNPNLLHDALTAARLAGHEKITLYIMDEIGPVTTVGGDNFVAVTMPVRLQ